jgi:hypothetical protein
VPTRRIEPENNARKDEEQRPEKENLSLMQRLLQKRQQGKKNADVIRIERGIDRLIKDDERYAKWKNEVMQLLLQQQKQSPVSTPPVQKISTPTTQTPEPELESKPTLETHKPSYIELKSKITGDINDITGGEHLTFNERHNLWEEHLQLSYGGEKEEDEDEEEYE